ncbi:MAG: hypothetical protein IKF64_07145 [Eubacterium sp.]|nr:hypothetical protein [Eubacterium sp.]
MKFELLSVKFRIDFSLFLIIAVALILKYENIIYLILFSSLHELGHITMLYLLGGKADEITVAYYGIGLRHSELLSPCCDMVFLLSGAAVNIVLCLIGISKEINFSLALINLLPLYPLDGGRAFKVLLNSAFSLNVSDSIMTVASFVFTSLILVCSIVLRNISLALISLYIVYYSINFKRFI